MPSATPPALSPVTPPQTRSGWISFAALVALLALALWDALSLWSLATAGNRAVLVCTLTLTLLAAWAVGWFPRFALAALRILTLYRAYFFLRVAFLALLVHALSGLAVPGWWRGILLQLLSLGLAASALLFYSSVGRSRLRGR
jgi:hypothetical protein